MRRALSRLAWSKRGDRSPLDDLRYAAIQLVEWRDFTAPVDACALRPSRCHR